MSASALTSVALNITPQIRLACGMTPGPQGLSLHSHLSCSPPPGPSLASRPLPGTSEHNRPVISRKSPRHEWACHPLWQRALSRERDPASPRGSPASYLGPWALPHVPLCPAHTSAPGRLAMPGAAAGGVLRWLRGRPVSGSHQDLPQGICEHLPWFPWASRPLQPGPPSARWLIHWPPRWPHCVTAVSFRGPGVPRPSCRMGRGLGGATGQGRLGVWGAQGATGPGAGPVHRGRGPSEGPGLPACTGGGAVVRQAGALHPRPRRPRRPRPPLTECCAAVSQAGVPPLPGFPAHCHRPDSRPLGGCPPPAGRS